jgi:Rps23 Pro-64 3,4-dihydroxylase Tpa1-like proline 4-hydroxylase
MTYQLIESLLPAPERLEERARQAASEFRDAHPYPHVVLDDFLDEALITKVVEEFPAPDDKRWGLHKHRNSDKLACGEDSFLGPVTRQLVWEMNSARFLSFLESLTGVEGIIPDAWLVGGGLHQVERGGFLEVHADFNYHPVWKLDRRLNLILYLNRDWPEEYGGHLELWDQEMRACARRISPIANRLVVFRTTDFSYHGHPLPLNCPPGQTRKSMAMYYYSNGRPQEERSVMHSTLYQQRPQAKPDD